VIVRGQGVPDGQGHSGAAVCIFDCYGTDPTAKAPTGKSGLARFVQVDHETCLVDLTIEGLSPGKHGVHIHECGDISSGWQSCGDHFNPTNVEHGDETHGHVGDLGNVIVDENGWGDLVLESNRIKVWDIIGRSIVVTENQDDLGTKKDDALSKKDGNSGNGILCGIIARSAGAFENTKLVCACNGNTLWEEARIVESEK
jgi:copper chaperone for superoxide dismutase